MLVFRITRAKYATDLSGACAKKYGGRWNHQGVPIVYSSASISLAFLELLVNADSFQLRGSFRVIGIEIVPGIKIKYLEENQLPKNWRTNDDPNILRNLGGIWQRQAKYLVLGVPSAVIPDEHNFLINPVHPDFKKISIKSSRVLEIDPRFIMTI